MKTLIILIFLLFFSGDKNPYLIYDKSGNLSNYKSLLLKAKTADIVFFGELHDNSISHWLQLELFMDLYNSKKDSIILGAEMFEADDQIVINEYLSKLYKSKTFEKEIKIWNNYKTDYKPLMDFAQKNKIPIIATNIPRRYASMVSMKGLKSLDSLEQTAKEWIAPLPIKVDLELPCYKKMLKRVDHDTTMNPKFMASSQAVKDATMGYFILKHWKKGKTFLHLNGSYHSDSLQGIVWYLKQQNPNLRIITISTVEQEKIEKLEDDYKNLADFIIAVDEDITKTY